MTTFRDAAARYMEALKGKRTEKFCRRQEQILNEHILPSWGDRFVSEILDSGDLFASLQDGIHALKLESYQDARHRLLGQGVSGVSAVAKERSKAHTLALAVIRHQQTGRLQ